MRHGDNLERRKREARDRERRKAEQKAREGRRTFELELTRRTLDNVEALHVLGGQADTRLINQVLGLIPELSVSVEEGDLDAETMQQLKGIYEAPSLPIAEKQNLSLMWLAGGLDKRIEGIKEELSMSSLAGTDRKHQLLLKCADLEEKRGRVMKQIRERSSERLKSLQNRMKS